MSNSKRILFVCLGNICRSPMAEGIFRQMANEMNIDVELDSCGTGGWHAGEAPDPRAQQCTRDHGFDISDLRARQFSRSDFDRFDLIFTMDESNHRDIIAQASTDEHRSKVKMMLNEIHPDENMSVPDPYFGGGAGFEHVFKMLNQSAEKVLGELSRCV